MFSSLNFQVNWCHVLQFLSGNNLSVGVYQLQTLHLLSAGITGKSAIDEVKRLTSIQEEILKQSQTGKLIAVLSTQIGASDTGLL